MYLERYSDYSIKMYMRLTSARLSVNHIKVNYIVNVVETYPVLTTLNGLPYYWPSIDERCLLWGMWVLFANKIKRHESHPGIVKTKSVDNLQVSWPTLASDIKQRVPEFVQCQITHSGLSKVPVNPWRGHTQTWQ